MHYYIIITIIIILSKLFNVGKLELQCFTSCNGVAPLLANVGDNDSLNFDDTEKANILQKQFSSVYIRK